MGYTFDLLLFHIQITGIIARFTPLGAGFVDIFIGQLHSESNDRIQ